MQLQQIKYLIAIAETKSIRKASENLFVSQQAISQSLKKLEDEYNVKLINRSVHGVTLTNEGERAVELGKELLDKAQALHTYLNSLNELHYDGELVVASIPTFHRYLLPKAKIGFMRHYPHITYTQLTLPNQQVIDAVAAADADIGFIGVPYQDNVPLIKMPSFLQFSPIKRLTYSVSVSSHSPLNNYHTLSLKGLLDYPIIFLKDQLQDDPESYPPYQIIRRFGNFKALIADSENEYSEMIAENFGVGVMVTGLAEEQQYPGTEVKPLRENIYTYIGYLICPQSSNEAMIKAFLDIFNKNVQ